MFKVIGRLPVLLISFPENEFNPIKSPTTAFSTVKLRVRVFWAPTVFKQEVNGTVGRIDCGVTLTCMVELQTAKN